MSISVVFKGLEGLNKFDKFLNSTLPDIFSVAAMGITSNSNNKNNSCNNDINDDNKNNG